MAFDSSPPIDSQATTSTPHLTNSHPAKAPEDVHAKAGNTCEDSNEYKGIIRVFFEEGYEIPSPAKREKMLHAHNCEIAEEKDPAKKLETIRLMADKELYEATHDRFNEALTPADLDDLKVTTDQQFGGIGLDLSVQPLDAHQKPVRATTVKEAERREKDHNLQMTATVDKPFDGTPAQRAGFQKDDVIAEVDGVSTINMDRHEVIEKIRGPVGSQAHIKVLRGGNPLDFTLTREVIQDYTVHGPFFRGKNADIAYIVTDHFGAKSADEMEEAMKKALELKPNLRSFAIDFRDNPGGLLGGATDMSQLFLKGDQPNGQTIIKVKERLTSLPEAPRYFTDTIKVDENAAYEIKSFNNHDQPPERQERYSYRANGKPIYGIMNEQTASASEVVIGALVDNHVMKTFGEPSWGKGIIQCIHDSKINDAASGMKNTCGRYFNPSGFWAGDANEHRHRRKPTFFVPTTPALKLGIVEAGSDQDSQLNAVIKYSEKHDKTKAPPKQRRME